VLVCRAFRDVFTPVLHASRSIILSQCPARTLGFRRKPLPSFLEHTKHFEVVFHEFSEAKLHYKTGDNRAFAGFVARILREMPNLQSFRSVCLSPEQERLLMLMLFFPLDGWMCLSRNHMALLGYSNIPSLLQL